MAPVTNSYYAILVVCQSIVIGLLPSSIHFALAHSQLNDVLSDFFNHSTCDDVPLDADTTPYKQATLDFMIVFARGLYFFGAFVGACTSVFITRTYSGRKETFISLYCVNIFATILISPVAYSARAYSAFVIGRFVLGITHGSFQCLIPIIISETVRRPTQVIYVGLIQMFYVFGQLWGQVTTHQHVFGNQCLWYVALMLPGLLCLAFIFFIPYSDNTVTWYIKRENQGMEIRKNSNRISIPPTTISARENARMRPSCHKHRKMRCGELADIDQEYLEKINEIADEDEFTKLTLMQLLTHARYRRQIAVSAVAMLGAHTSGAPVVRYIPDVIWEPREAEGDSWDLFTIALVIVGTALSVPAIALMKRYGCRLLFLIGLAVTVPTHLILGLGESLPDGVNLVSGILTCFSSACVVSVAFWTIPCEVTSDVERSVMFPMSYALYEGTHSILAVTMPYAWAAWGRRLFIPYAVTAAIMVIYMMVCLPNTTHLTVKEMQQKFADATAAAPFEHRSSIWTYFKRTNVSSDHPVVPEPMAIAEENFPEV